MSARLCSYESTEPIFTPEECAQIRTMGKELGLKDATTDLDKSGTQLTVMRRNCQIFFVKKGQDGWGWVFDRLNEHGHALNKKRWGFETQDIASIQYTSYGMGQFYAAHFDNGTKTTEHRKLSISVQLSSPSDYVGGALRFWSMNDSVTAPKTQGAMTCFPSYLMHVAKPVWWGRREVLVSWFDGPKRLR